ncbi:MAG: DUF1015 domain-containing protein [Eubacterium sp.]|nr:DUF1015 domain-containing protein [Eubacterium sp.]
MANIRPFRAIRPIPDKAAAIAALPYDVYNRQEAKEAVKGNPDSFLNIDRAETQFDDSVDTYAECVYEKAHDLLWEKIEKGDFLREDAPCYYIYELTMDGRVQTGIVACASIDDYENQVIKKHENTRADKEADRIHHVDSCNAQTGPIFLAYRANAVIREIVAKTKQTAAVYDFTSEDGIRHRVWVTNAEDDILAIRGAFDSIGEIYIADGHHRAASAVKVGLKRRAEHPDYDGSEEFNYFLSVLFPDEELMIMDYNRVVKDLNGLSGEAFLEKVQELFVVKQVAKEDRKPGKKGDFSLYLNGNWYLCTIREADRSTDPVKGLDVSLLQEMLLAPVLGIGDPKTDKRIDFVGGIRGLDELERRCSADGDCVCAFAMYPTDIQELFAVADAGLLMPPKSTWFEPKLRSGLFIHEI